MEYCPIQAVHAEPGPQPPMQLGRCLAGGAVGAEVVVGLLATADEVAPQLAADAGDYPGLELPWHEHPPPPADLTSRPGQPTPRHSQRGSQQPSLEHSARQPGPDLELASPNPMKADASRCPAAPGQLTGVRTAAPAALLTLFESPCTCSGCLACFPACRPSQRSLTSSLRQSPKCWARR